MKKLLIILFLISPYANANLNKLKNCYSEISTININKCIQALTASTEREIEEKLRDLILNYKESISTLKNEGDLPVFHDIMADRTILESQDKWKLFRDTHCTVLYELEGSGTMRTTIYADCIYKLTLQRLSDIETYSD